MFSFLIPVYYTQRNLPLELYRDNVMAVHTKTPHLDENQRAIDAVRAKRHPPLTKDLNYNIIEALVKPRVQTMIISNKPFNPLSND